MNVEDCNPELCVEDKEKLFIYTCKEAIDHYQHLYCVQVLLEIDQIVEVAEEHIHKSYLPYQNSASMLADNYS